MASLTRRKKIPLIYHFLNITNAYSALTVQVKVDTPQDTRLVLLVRHEKLPTLTACDFVKPLANVGEMDGEWIKTDKIRLKRSK